MGDKPKEKQPYDVYYVEDNSCGRIPFSKEKDALEYFNQNSTEVRVYGVKYIKGEYLTAKERKLPWKKRSQ